MKMWSWRAVQTLFWQFNLTVEELNMITICVLSLLLFRISGSRLGTLTSQLLKEGNSETLCGTIHDISVRSLQACSLACLQQDMCKAVLFADGTGIPQNCKLVTTESETEINSLDFSDYTQYFLTMNCTGFDNPNSSFIPPLNWNSGCPVAYFPLDSDSEGTAYGTHAVRMDFSQPGKVGNGLTFLNPYGSLRASFMLHGTFTGPEYCFPTPDVCDQGFTVGSGWTYWENMTVVKRKMSSIQNLPQVDMDSKSIGSMAKASL